MSFFEILETLLIGPLKLVFELVFSLAYWVTGNLGLGIIVLSLIMNILLLPMYRRADAMQDEARDTDARLRDGVAHIKKVFSGDERMMVLQTYYRQNHYSPLSALNGSLSLLLEIPFFMAAYQVLSTMTIMEGMSFGPIADLFQPDGLLVLGGITLNLLPILMTAVNVVSCLLYLKGHPLRTKIQLYAMALFFLFFLYDSPSCLVFYWTLNNVFSLVKTIFYKLKNPQKVLTYLCGAAGLGLVVFAFVNPSDSLTLQILLIGIGMMLLLPLAVRFVPGLAEWQQSPKWQSLQPDKKLFLMGALFASVLTGLLIPATFIAASPQEYVNIHAFYNPLWYVVSSAALAAGTFLVWGSVFYYLSAPKGKAVFARAMWVLCGVMLVNYMFFGTDLGIISAELRYEKGLEFTPMEKLLNLGVLFFIAAVLYVIVVRKPKLATTVLLITSLTMGTMSGLHVFTIQDSIQRLNRDSSNGGVSDLFRLSKTGQNVVVLVLDRAMGDCVPFLLEERPQLKEQFSGFTYYSNVISHGAFTNFGMPGVMGGYEYTPVEMNRRDQELLVDKHNEALLVMPVSFQQEGYEVTVCDPPYANYQWIPDLTIYEDYPDMKVYNTQGIFVVENEIEVRTNNSRNFFRFALMKSLPLAVQWFLYDDGAYNQMTTDSAQVITGLTHAEGTNSAFRDWFTTLMGMTEMTEITEETVNTYLSFYNGAPHEPQLLQMPDYTMEQHIDNSAYFAQHANGITADGVTLQLSSEYRLTHYHANMASMIQLGNWFDYLREQGVYDNTRIIIVSDHGQSTGQIEALAEALPSSEVSADKYFPLLMVKDFGSQEFTTDSTFMTNADVPFLAMNGIIENPTNPFTGKAISTEEKTAHDQFLIISQEWDVKENNGTAFMESNWASVKDNIWDPDNWTNYHVNTVLKDHMPPEVS